MVLALGFCVGFGGVFRAFAYCSCGSPAVVMAEKRELWRIWSFNSSLFHIFEVGIGRHDLTTEPKPKINQRLLPTASQSDSSIQPPLQVSYSKDLFILENSRWGFPTTYCMVDMQEHRFAPTNCVPRSKTIFRVEMSSLLRE